MRRPFAFMLRRLQHYAGREGHARVPQDYVEDDGIPLGSWVGVQRAAYAKNRIDPARRRALEHVPGWAWRTRSTPMRLTFEKAYSALRSFVKREGHARVLPERHVSGIALGEWVDRQRVAFRRGELAPKEARRLERLTGWSWDPRRDDFANMLAVLHRFAAREGHARVPHAHREAGSNLGWWVASRRRAFQRGRLSRQDIRALEAMPGWVWDAHLGYDSEPMLAALQLFVRKHRHARVPAEYVHRGLPLGKWIGGRRVAFRRGRLSPSLARRLQRFPGWRWNPQRDDYQRLFSLLERYAKREGHARVPACHLEDGARLGEWVTSRRRDFRVGRLSKERIALFEALPGWTWGARTGPTSSRAAAAGRRADRRHGNRSALRPLRSR